MPGTSGLRKYSVRLGFRGLLGYGLGGFAVRRGCSGFLPSLRRFVELFLFLLLGLCGFGFRYIPKDLEPARFLLRRKDAVALVDGYTDQRLELAWELPMAHAYVGQ